MKFLIEFSESNLQKFRNFIKLCNKTFTKSGIIMTIEKNMYIRVAPDPFSISEKFERDYFETKIMEIYKNFTFIQYVLIPISQSKKNSTYNKLELKVSNKNNNNNNINQNKDSLNENIITFRIALEELNKLNELLQTNFLFSNQLTIKAAAKPDFMNNEESKNYSNTYLSIFDKPKNSIKSGILFKPLKYCFRIIDYEDEEYIESENNNIIANLGNHLFCSIIKSKFFKKFCTMASKNFNKIMDIYTFKQRDLKEKTDKNHLIISYLNNSFSIGYFLSNNFNLNIPNNVINIEEFKKIYKIKINSEILLKLLKNFNFENDNPDLISIWTKGLVMKTEFFLNNTFEDIENINNNNYIDNNDGEDNFFEEENSENAISFMSIKSLIYYTNPIEIIDYDENNDEKLISKKKYVLDLIDNNIDDMHEELNKSVDYSIDNDDIKEKEIYKLESQYLDDEDEIEKENNGIKNDISNEEEKSEEEDKKKKKKIKEAGKQKKTKKTKKNNKKK